MKIYRAKRGLFFRTENVVNRIDFVCEPGNFLLLSTKPTVSKMYKSYIAYTTKGFGWLIIMKESVLGEYVEVP
jgi:hypothetical protein